jgi:hypothetical protein
MNKITWKTVETKKDAKARAKAEEEAAKAEAKEKARVAVLAQREAARVRAEEKAASAREVPAAEKEAARVRAEEEDKKRQRDLYDDIMTSTYSKMETLYVNEFEPSNKYRDKRHNWKWDKGYLSCRVFRQPRLINNPISSLLSFQLPGNFTQVEMNMRNIFGCSESELRRIMKFGNTGERDKCLKSCYQEVGWCNNELGRGTSKGHKYKFAFTTKPSSPMHGKFMDMNVQLIEVAYSATCFPIKDVLYSATPIKYNISLKFQMPYFVEREDFKDSDGKVVSYPKFSLEVNYHVSHDPTSLLSGKIPSRLDAVKYNEEKVKYNEETGEEKGYFYTCYDIFRKLGAPEKEEFIVSSGKYKMRFKNGNLVITGD